LILFNQLFFNNFEYEKTVASLLAALAILSFIMAAIAAFFAVTAFIDRSKYGAGLMLADAEIFSMTAVFFIVAGLLCLWVSRRIKKNPSRNE